ncbi:MAG: serpin family protein [Chthoniobacterales bacterium]|nr:serpin family protein [Chthoniobacterales bacterium]
MNSFRILLCSLFVSVLLYPTSGAADPALAATATNELGLDLHRKLATGDNNLCLSPYSIQAALAMTFGGADGATRTEMARVLHFPNDTEPHESFAALQGELEAMATRTAQRVAASKKYGGPGEPITLAIANRLFPQKGYSLRESFLALVKKEYGAPPDPLDFRKDAAAATRQINDWVAEQTRKRIRDLIPAGALDATTRLVLANAVYLKAPWAEEFSESATKPEPFHVHGGAPEDVPTMQKTGHHFGYAKRDGFTALSIPYIGGELQFLVLLPDTVDGLTALESKLTSGTLKECAKLDPRFMRLHLPKFKLEPPTIALASQLESLGMRTAFDRPPGSANFDRLAPRKPEDYLYISQVFHKTFIAVDEKGTEAAAATAVAMVASAAMRPEEPIEVKVDRPFFYAVQHMTSGACLFVGRVTDPR